MSRLGPADAAADRGVDDADIGRGAFCLDLPDERAAYRAGVDQRLQNLSREQAVGSGKRTLKNLKRWQGDDDRVACVCQLLR